MKRATRGKRALVRKQGSGDSADKSPKKEPVTPPVSADVQLADADVLRPLTRDEIITITNEALPFVRGVFAIPWIGVELQSAATGKKISESAVSPLQKEQRDALAKQTVVERLKRQLQTDAESTALKGLKTELERDEARTRVAEEYAALFERNDSALQEAVDVLYELYDLPRRQLRRALAGLLSEVEVFEDSIAELRTRVVQQHRRSEVEPGTPVGNAATDAYSAPATQLTLDSFHMTGTKMNADFGVNAVLSVLGGTDAKYAGCIVHFRDPPGGDALEGTAFTTFEDVVTLFRPQMEARSVYDYCVDISIERAELLYARDTSVDQSMVSPEPWWYATFEAMTTVFTRATGFMMRLELNLDEMYARRVDQFRIAAALNEAASGRYYAVASPLLTARRAVNVELEPGVERTGEGERLVGGENAEEAVNATVDVSVAYIDILPSQSAAAGETGVWTSSPAFAMLTVLGRELSKILVSGIAGIKTVVPGTQKVLEVIRGVRRVEGEEEEGAMPQWYLYLSWVEMRLRSISRRRLELLFGEIGASEMRWLDDPRPAFRGDMRREYDQYEGNVIMLACRSASDPLETLRNRLQKDEMDAVQHEQQQTLLKARLYSEGRHFEAARVAVSRPPTRLEQLALVAMADVEGANLRALWSLPFVDPHSTFSNQLSELTYLLGQEAGRNHQMKMMFAALFQRGTNVDMRHLVLIVDYQMHLGRTIKMSALSQLKSSDMSALGKAAFTKPLNTILDAAAMGERRPATNPHAAAIIGQTIGVGTGIVQLVFDSRREEEIKASASRQRPEDIEGAVERMEDDAFGRPVALETDNGQILVPQGKSDIPFESLGATSSAIVLSASGARAELQPPPVYVPRKPTVAPQLTRSAYDVVESNWNASDRPPPFGSEQIHGSKALQDIGPVTLTPVAPDISDRPPIGKPVSDDPYDAYSTAEDATSVPQATPATQKRFSSLLEDIFGIVGSDPTI